LVPVGYTFPTLGSFVPFLFILLWPGSIKIL
jgi:hypothetical protein